MDGSPDSLVNEPTNPFQELLSTEVMACFPTPYRTQENQIAGGSSCSEKSTHAHVYESHRQPVATALSSQAYFDALVFLLCLLDGETKVL